MKLEGPPEGMELYFHKRCFMLLISWNSTSYKEIFLYELWRIIKYTDLFDLHCLSLQMKYFYL